MVKNRRVWDKIPASGVIRAPRPAMVVMVEIIELALSSPPSGKNKTIRRVPARVQRRTGR